MPALPPVPATLKVTYEISDGVDFSSIVRDFMAYSGGPPTDADCLGIATALHGQLVTSIIPQMSSLNQLLGVKVEDLSSPTSGIGEFLSTVGGSRAGLGLSGGTAVLVNKHIARRYRGGKPRSYWSLFTAPDILTAQTWKSASVTALQTALNAYYTFANGLTVGSTVVGGLVNVSYYHGFVSVQNPITLRWKNLSKPRVGGPLVDVITGISVHGAPASQRRRNLTA